MTPKHSLALSAYLQSTKAPWTSLLVVTAGKRAESLVLPPNGFVLKIIKGRQCKTPASLFAEFAQAMKFPDYFGHNWDALEESLVELDWAGSSGVVIYYDHIDGLLAANGDQFETLVEICRDAVASWKEDETAFVVIFSGTKPPKGVSKLSSKEE